jgi:hypothetical protein
LVSSFSSCIAYLISVILRLGRVGERHAHGLHRQRRGALLRAALVVVDERPGDALEVDAVVLVELVVLGRDDRVLHVLRDVVEGDVAAELVVHDRELRLAVRREDPCHLRGGRLGELAGQLGEARRARLGRQARHRDGRERGGRDHHAGQQAADHQRSTVGEKGAIAFPGPESHPIHVSHGDPAPPLRVTPFALL